jgi:hypothetical protein
MTKTSTNDLLTGLFIERYRELIEGMPEDEPTWVTTGGREGGLIGSVAGLSAEQASRDFAGASIASHVEHVRWAIELANGFFRGDDARPSWSESWSVKNVDDTRWEALRAGLESAATELMGHLGSKQSWEEALSVTGALASFGHTAYHLGAIRQLRKQVLAPAGTSAGGTAAGSAAGIGVVHARVQY